MPLCPICDHENRAGVLICENCGADLYDSLIEIVATKQLERIKTRKLAPDITPGSNPSSHPLVIQVRGNDQPIPVERTGRLALGRMDPERPEEAPEIDLTPYGASEQGVSREHAALDASVSPPMLFDLGSYNGTFINGQKLTPGKPYPVQSGDEVRLGRLVMQLYYK